MPRLSTEPAAGLPPARPVRVLLVDDHPVVRTGLRALLAREPDLEVVGEAGNADEALAAAHAAAPDLIVLDVIMPGTSGIELLPLLGTEAPQARVLMLSVDDGYVREALSAGANGYVLKDADEGELLRAVRAVAAGGTYLQSSLGARLVVAESRAQREADADPLTERELEVLRRLALGHTKQEIGELLHISVRTVEAHRSHLMWKLRAAGRSDLVRYAIERGMLDRSDEA